MVEPYWRAFGELHGSRQIGMDEGGIPFSEIASYMRAFPPDEPEVFVAMIQAMDRVYLDHRAKQRQIKPEPVKAPQPPRNR